MAHIDAIICSGFSPSGRVLRAALRNISKKKDITVISSTPAAAGLQKYVREIRKLDPNTTLVIDGCDGSCGLQVALAMGIVPSKTLILDNNFLADEKSIKAAEEKILKALKEMGA